MVGFLEILTCQLNPNHLGIWAQCQQNQRLILDPIVIIGRYSLDRKNLTTKGQSFEKSSLSLFYLIQTHITARSSLSYFTHRKLRWPKQHQSQKLALPNTQRYHRSFRSRLSTRFLGWLATNLEVRRR